MRRAVEQRQNTIEKDFGMVHTFLRASRDLCRRAKATLAQHANQSYSQCAEGQQNAHSLISSVDDPAQRASC